MQGHQRRGRRGRKSDVREIGHDVVQDTHVGDGDKQNNRGQKPEGAAADRRGRRHPLLFTGRLARQRRLTSIRQQAFVGRLRTNNKNCRRDGQDADDQAERKISSLPAVVQDDPVGQGVKDHSADACGGKDDPHCQSPSIDEPVGDHHGDGDNVRSRAADP